MGLKPRPDPHAAWRSQAVQALSESIEHWERMRDGRERDRERPVSSDCACCQRFLDENYACGQCPVALRTGRDDCKSTPFYDAAKLFWSEPQAGFPAAAQAEIDFLIETRRLVRAKKVNPK